MFGLSPGPLLLGLLLQNGTGVFSLPPAVPADEVRELYWESLNQHLSKPFRVPGTLVLVPAAVPGELPPLRPTDDPAPGKKKKVKPGWRAMYEAHGVAVERD